MIKKISIILSVICFFIGFVVSKLIDVPGITIKNEVDGVAILSILVTVLVAYVLYRYFDKAKENRVREKDLIIGRVEEVYQYINETANKINDRKIEYIRAAALLKRLNIQIGNIENLLKVADINIDSKCHGDIIKIVRRLRELLTDSPSNGLSNIDLENIDLPIEVKEGIIFYSESRFNEINREYDKLKNKILEYQLVINNS